MEQVGRAAAVRRAEAGGDDLRPRPLAERSCPQVFLGSLTGAEPDCFDGRDSAQIVNVPVGTAHRREVMRQPPAQPARAARTACIGVPAWRKVERAQPPDAKARAGGQTQDEHVGSGCPGQ